MSIILVLLVVISIILYGKTTKDTVPAEDSGRLEKLEESVETEGVLPNQLQLEKDSEKEETMDQEPVLEQLTENEIKMDSGQSESVEITENISEATEDLSETTEDTSEDEEMVPVKDDKEETTEVPSKESDDRIQDAAEDGRPRIVISNTEAKPGDTVFVTATLVNNPGILGMSIALSYEEGVLELIDAQSGEAFSEVLTMSHSKTLGNGCVFLWDGEEVLKDQILDGSVLKLQFKISEKAAPGKCTIILICNKGGTVDNNLQIVDVDVINGFINIKE